MIVVIELSLRCTKTPKILMNHDQNIHKTAPQKGEENIDGIKMEKLMKKRSQKCADGCVALSHACRIHFLYGALTFAALVQVQGCRGPF